MPRGVKRSEREIAQEAVDKQQRIVDQIDNKIVKLQAELDVLEEQSNHEYVRLTYLKANPALEQPHQKMARLAGWDQPELPTDEEEINQRINKLLEREDGRV